MEKFGEYLKNYLKENKISFVSASKICGIDRTLISKYANGTRFPKEQKDVIEMARFLKMSKKQEEAFCEAYQRDTFFEKYGVDYGLVKRIFEMEDTEKKEPIDEVMIKREEFPNPCIMELQSKQMLLDTMAYLLEESKNIRILANPQNDEWKELFVEKASDQKYSNLECILLFDKNSENSRNEKLESLTNLLPFLCSVENGSVYYYYCVGNHGLSQYTLENYIMTEKGILFFSPDLEKGFFSSQNDVCTFYQKDFLKRTEHCRIFARSGQKMWEKWQQERVVKEYKKRKNKEIRLFLSKTDLCWILLESQKNIVCMEENEMVEFWKAIM